MQNILKCVSACVCALVATPFAMAADAPYPSKVIRMILPFPPGGPTDILGRVVGQKLTESLGQPVVIDNRPGAGGNVGTDYASKQAPDGYTIALVSPALAISPSLYKKLGYDPLKDLAMVSLVAQIPNVLLIHPSVPAKTLKDFVQLARGNPGKLNFGSGGLGTGQHLAGEMLNVQTKIKLEHVPYKGSNQAMMGMIGGQIEMVVIGVPSAVQQVQAGRVRALAVLAAERAPVLPDVQTAKEAGFAGFEVLSWYGIAAPAGTPREIIARLNGDIARIMKSPESRERITGVGFDPAFSTPEQFTSFLQTEIARYANVVKSAGIQPE